MDDVLDKPVVFDPTLNNMPRIVDEIGVYRTRDGSKVLVHEIKPYPDKEVTAFTVKGSLVIMKGKKETYKYNIWHPSGRKYGLQESKHDIVEKIKGGFRWRKQNELTTSV